MALLTSLPASELTAAQWPAANRAAWGIESGLNQRMEVSYLEDHGRVRHPRAMRILGMLRRFSHSLFMHWRSRQKRPHHQTTTDFFSAMNAEHHRYAFGCLFARKPNFKTLS